MIRAPRLVGCLALAALIASASIAAAEPSKVVLVRPAERSAAEATLRLEAELRAADFEVVIIDATPGIDPRAQVEEARIEPRPFATVAIVATPRGAAIDVWVADHLSGKTSVRRVSDAGAPGALAVRAVELLRASLLELERRPAEPSAPAEAKLPRDVARWMKAKPSKPSKPSKPEPEPAESAPAPAEVTPARAALFARPAIEATATLIQSFAGFGTALAPEIRVSHPVPFGFAARLSLLTTVTVPQVTSSRGGASLYQDRVHLELVRAFGRAERQLVPMVFAGAGAYHLRAQGRGLAPYYEGRTLGAWAFDADVGAGAAIRLDDRIALALDARAVFLLPEPVLRFAGEETARAGAAMLLASFGALASF